MQIPDLRMMRHERLPRRHGGKAGHRHSPRFRSGFCSWHRSPRATRARKRRTPGRRIVGASRLRRHGLTQRPRFLASDAINRPGFRKAIARFSIGEDAGGGLGNYSNLRATNQSPNTSHPCHDGAVHAPGHRARIASPGAFARVSNFRGFTRPSAIVNVRSCHGSMGLLAPFRQHYLRGTPTFLPQILPARRASNGLPRRQWPSWWQHNCYTWRQQNGRSHFSPRTSEPKR